MEEGRKKIVIGLAVIAIMVVFFFLVKQASPEYLKELGFALPLPLFTLIIALIDGFNPCTLWVLTFLLALLISVSHSMKRICAVGYTFVFIVFVIYFLFMAAWLNIFLFFGYFDPIRIAVACIALVAGAINAKEFFFFRSGVTLMIQEQHKGFLVRKMEQMKSVIKHGSIPALIGASALLATFSSLVELPCTAGWPVIYTKILAEKGFAQTIGYYAYLLFYSLVYIMPLAVVIAAFCYLFRGKQITKEQMQVIKLIGGVIMIALGIVLLVNPELLMLV